MSIEFKSPDQFTGEDRERVYECLERYYINNDLVPADPDEEPRKFRQQLMDRVDASLQLHRENECKIARSFHKEIVESDDKDLEDINSLSDLENFGGMNEKDVVAVLAGLFMSSNIAEHFQYSPEAGVATFGAVAFVLLAMKPRTSDIEELEKKARKEGTIPAF